MASSNSLPAVQAIALLRRMTRKSGLSKAPHRKVMLVFFVGVWAAFIAGFLCEPNSTNRPTSQPNALTAQAQIASDTTSDFLMQAGRWEFPDSPWTLESQRVNEINLTDAMQLDCTEAGSDSVEHRCLLDFVPSLGVNIVQQSDIAYRWICYSGLRVRVYFSKDQKLVYGGVIAVTDSEDLWQVTTIRPRTPKLNFGSTLMPTDLQNTIIASRVSEDRIPQAQLVQYSEFVSLADVEAAWQRLGWSSYPNGVWKRGNESTQVTRLASETGQPLLQIVRRKTDSSHPTSKFIN